MKHLILICTSLCSSLSLHAQYGYAYHSANQLELNRAAAARQQAQSDQHFRNIAPSSKSAISTGSYNAGSAAGRNEAAPPTQTPVR